MAQGRDLVWGTLRDVVRQCRIPPQVIKKCIQVRFLEPGLDYVDMPGRSRKFDLSRLAVRQKACINLYCDAYGRPTELFMREKYLDRPGTFYFNQRLREQHAAAAAVLPPDGEYY